MGKIRVGAVAVVLAGAGLLTACNPNPHQPVTRIDAGGDGAAGNPAWGEDSVSRPSRFGNARSVGVEQVATADEPIDMSHNSLPDGTPSSIFERVRVDKRSEKPNVAYVLPVETAGAYTVRLYFVEVWAGYTGANSRVQDVWVNGALVDDNLDVAGRAGGAHKAFARTYEVTTSANQPAIQVELTRVRQATAIAAVELLAPEREPVDRPGTWFELGASPAYGEDAFVVQDGYIYRGGGQIFVSYQQVVSTRQHDRYDPRTGEWTSLPPLPEAVDHIQGIVHAGRIWYVGGTIGGPGTGLPRGSTARVTSFDPSTGQLRSHAPMPRPRGAGGIAAVNGRIYYFGGLVSPMVPSAHADVYDIATDTWSRLPDLPVAKDHFKAAVVGTDIHLPGGRPGNPGAPMRRHDVFNTTSRTYRTAAQLPFALGGSGLVELNGKLIMAGGETRAPDAARTDVLSYDPAADRWTRLERMPIARHGIDLAVCGNAVYVVGGMGHFAAANVNDTVDAFTLDGSAPTCPRPSSSEEVAPTGEPSVMNPTVSPEIHRIAAREAANGDAGIFCAI